MLYTLAVSCCIQSSRRGIINYLQEVIPVQKHQSLFQTGRPAGSKTEEDSGDSKE